MRSSLALLLAIFLAAGPAAAQQVELPQTKKDKDEDKQKRKPRLSLDLGAEESYESNVPYTQLLGEDDFVTRGVARLTATLPITRGSFELAAEGAANRYRTFTGLDRYTWGGAAGFERRISRTSDVELKARSARGYARDNPRLDVLDTLTPLTLMRSDTGEGAWRQRLGRTAELKLEARGESFRFESVELQNGWSAGTRVGFSNRFHPRLGLGADLSYGRTATDPRPPASALVPGRVGLTVQVESAVATMNIGLVPDRLELLLEGGAARFGTVGDPRYPEGVTKPASGSGAPSVAIAPDAPPTQPQVTPQLGATLTGTFGKHALTAMATRRIEQSYGVGAIGINRVLTLGYRGEWTHWLAFLLTGTDNRNSSSNALLLSTGKTLAASFDFTLPWGFGTRATYAYWDREDPLRNWRSHTASVAISKKFDWR